MAGATFAYYKHKNLFVSYLNQDKNDSRSLILRISVFLNNILTKQVFLANIFVLSKFIKNMFVKQVLFSEKHSKTHD